MTGLRFELDADGFWGAMQRRNATVTIPHAERRIEETGAVANFSPPPRERRTPRFSDSDVYKVLEAMVWAGMAERVERLTATIAQALEPDGYLNTYWGAFEGRERYSDLADGHELYCAGHLIQAAVAAARTGGSAALLDLGRAVADHVCREFGPDGPPPGIDGHPEIELALVELHRVTGERRYLDTAKAMVDRFGHGLLGGAAYHQDDVPVRDAEAMNGHAVRALYLRAGAVDVAVETGDDDLLAAVERQWRATIERRTYITGGMGSRADGEAFGDDFELPSDAYAETCAGVGAVMLAWRLLLATGDAGYADQIERTLHNVVAACPSAEGDAFFYTNPLESEGGMRSPWFTVPCCPTNVARLMASLGTYVATADADGVQIHLYAAGTVRAGVATLAVRTRYPWDGEIEIEVLETRPEPWTLSLRIPSWARGATVDGMTGRRAWKRGDVVRLALPMEPRWTPADPRIEELRGCAALERGPLVYCEEDGELIPYFTWANRGPSTMRVWLPEALQRPARPATR